MQLFNSCDCSLNPMYRMFTKILYFRMLQTVNSVFPSIYQQRGSKRGLHPRLSVPRLYFTRLWKGSGFLSLGLLHGRVVLGLTCQVYISFSPFLHLAGIMKWQWGHFNLGRRSEQPMNLFFLTPASAESRPALHECCVSGLRDRQVCTSTFRKRKI